MASLKLTRLRPVLDPWAVYVPEEVGLDIEHEDIIYPSSSKNVTTRWYSFPDETLQWLKWCLDLHDDCTYWTRRALAKSFLPDRLIDVNSPESTSEPRLVITKNIPTIDKRYLALGHRWPKQGNPVLEHIQTKKNSLRNRLNSIDEEKLSICIRCLSMAKHTVPLD